MKSLLQQLKDIHDDSPLDIINNLRKQVEMSTSNDPDALEIWKLSIKKQVI